MKEQHFIKFSFTNVENSASFRRPLRKQCPRGGQDNSW